MNNSKTPKIVVGVGLAAIYATGLAIFTLPRTHDNVVAQNASDAPTAQIAAASVPAPAIVPESSATPTSVVEQPAATNVVAASVASSAAKTPAASRTQVASVATVTSTENREVENSNRTNEGSPAGNEPANSAGDLPSSPQAQSVSSVNDSQITAEVKSQIAAVAPAGAIDVTSKDGVVELTGSVPSQEVIDKARLAASNVADVRDVNASALLISN
ncbi:MAG: BON domain-containing protein [Steroidobacteraceae bacterium]